MKNREEYIAELIKEHSKERYDSEPIFFLTFATALVEKDELESRMLEAKEAGDAREYRSWHSQYMKYLGTLSTYFKQIREIKPKESGPVDGTKIF